MIQRFFGFDFGFTFGGVVLLVERHERRSV